MLYNKNQFKKVNDKKVLHKIKKHWVTISIAMLSIGGGAIATTNASANTINQNNNNNDNNTINQANHSLNDSQLSNQHSKLVNNHTQSNINGQQNYDSLSKRNEGPNNRNISDSTITKEATNLHNNIIKNTIKSHSFNNGSKYKSYKAPALGNMYSPQTVTRSWNNLSNNVKFISDGDNGNAGGDIMEVTPGTIIKPITQVATSSAFPPALPFDTNSNNWKLKLDSDVALEVGPSDQLASTFAGNVATSDNQHIWTHFKDMDLSRAHIIKSKNNDSDSDSDNFANNMGDEPSMSDVFSDTFADDTNLQNLNIDLPNFSGTTNLNGSLQDDISLTNLKLNSHESFEKGGNVTPGPLDDPNLILINSDGNDATEEVSDGSQPAGWYYVAHNAVIHLVDSDGNTIQNTTSSILMPANVNKYYRANINNQILSKISLPKGFVFVNNPNTYYKMKSYGDSYYVNAQVFNVAPLLKFDYQNEYEDKNNEYNNVPNEMALYDEAQLNYENQVTGQKALYSPQSLSAQNNSISSEDNYDEEAYSNTDNNISGVNSLLSTGSASEDIIQSLEESSRLLTPIQSSSINNLDLQTIESDIKSLANNNNQSIQAMNNSANIINSKANISPIEQQSSITSYYNELQSLSTTAYSNYTGYESNVNLVDSYSNQAMSASSSASALNDTLNIISDINSISGTGVTCQSYESIYGNDINTAKSININAMSSANDLAKDNDLAKTDLNNIVSLYSNATPIPSSSNSSSSTTPVTPNSSDSSMTPNSNSTNSNSIASIEANIHTDYDNEFSDGATEFNDLSEDIQVYDSVCDDYNNMTIHSSFLPSNLDILAKQNDSLISNEHTVEQDYLENSNAVINLNAQLNSLQYKAPMLQTKDPSMSRPRVLLGALPENNTKQLSSDNKTTNDFNSNVTKLSSLATTANDIAGQTSNTSIHSYANELFSMNINNQSMSSNYNNDMARMKSYNSQAMSASSVANNIHNEAKNANFNSFESLNSKATQMINQADSYATDETRVNSSAMLLTSSVATNMSNANSIYSNIISLAPNVTPPSSINTSFEDSVNNEITSIVNSTNLIATSANNNPNVNAIRSYTADNSNVESAVISLATAYTSDNTNSANYSKLITSASNTGSLYASQEQSAEAQSNTSLADSLQGEATNYKIMATKDLEQAKINNNHMKAISSEATNDISLAMNNYKIAEQLLKSSNSSNNPQSSASQSASASTSASLSASISASESISNSVQTSMSLSQYNSSVNTYNSQQASIRTSESINNSIANSISSSIANSEAQATYNTSNNISENNSMSFVAPISLNSVNSINSSIPSSENTNGTNNIPTSNSSSNNNSVHFGNTSSLSHDHNNGSSLNKSNPNNNYISQHKTIHKKSLPANNRNTHSNNNTAPSNSSNNVTGSTRNIQRINHVNNYKNKQDELGANDKKVGDPISSNINNISNKSNNRSNNNGNELPQTNEVSSSDKALAEISLMLSASLGELSLYIDKHRDDN